MTLPSPFEDLPERVRTAYERCKLPPEIAANDDGTFTVKGDAYLALLELRNLSPDVLLAFEQCGEFVSIKREA